MEFDKSCFSFTVSDLASCVALILFDMVCFALLGAHHAADETTQIPLSDHITLSCKNTYSLADVWTQTNFSLSDVLINLKHGTQTKVTVALVESKPCMRVLNRTRHNKLPFRFCIDKRNAASHTKTLCSYFIVWTIEKKERDGRKSEKKTNISAVIDVTCQIVNWRVFDAIG